MCVILFAPKLDSYERTDSKLGFNCGDAYDRHISRSGKNLAHLVPLFRSVPALVDFKSAQVSQNQV
jgi:hypothetical protein